MIQDKCKPLLKQFQFPNSAFIEPAGLSGGIVLLWKNGFQCYILDASLNTFNTLIQADPSMPEFLLTCMYGYSRYDNMIRKRSSRTSYTRLVIKTVFPRLC